jgi:DNA-binding transcriptional LysR family regulator
MMDILVAAERGGVPRAGLRGAADRYTLRDVPHRCDANARKDMHLLIDAALHGAGLAIVMEDEVARFHRRWTLGPVDDWSPPLSGYHLYYREQRTKCDQCGAAHAFELRAAIGFVGL